MIGQKVLDGTAVAVALYHPKFYLEYVLRTDGEIAWDQKYPDWKSNAVVGLLLVEPSRPMNDDQISETFDIPKDMISDKLRDAVSPKQQMLALPFSEVFQDGCEFPSELS